MQVSYLKIQNFRGIKYTELFFNGHTLLVGKNNVGKSSICEALDLLLGPDRLSRSINEYDFYNAKYLTKEGELVPIVIEAVLTDLSEEAHGIFSRHLEFWNKDERRVLSSGEIDLTSDENVLPCLRLHFKGLYDAEEDEFSAKTYYSHSPDEVDENTFTEVFRSQKRQIGFLYLRALRTGSRALSLEKGSLLDVLLRLGEIRPRLWEDTRKRLLELDPAIDESVEPLQTVLANIEQRIGQYIPLDTADRTTRLFVSQLTRDHLRKTMSFFMSTSPDQTPVPFQDLGTGTLSTLVFALLSAISELKKDVIFAMEEPEIAIPPHTQRRIVNYLTNNTSQSFTTSHSPYIIERFDPEQITILRRDADAKVEGTTVTLVSGIKAKNYQRNMRHAIAESLLGEAVIVGEGLVEYQVLSAASEIMEKEPNNYPFDLSGITFFDSGGDGSLKEYGGFFRSLGLKSYAFYDKKKRTDAEIQGIADNFNIFTETDYKGIENLLSEEVPIEIQWKYLQAISDELISGPAIPQDKPIDDDIKKLTRQVLIDNKGAGRGADLIRHCDVSNLPTSIKNFLQQIYLEFPKPMTVQPIVFETVQPDEAVSIPDTTDII
ncbi:MAG: ATP-dependent endonuclease [Candidatus Magasanikbacteria bacterium CG_4_10_14_0_2_um_filter_41_10]|uniref:ATP-dependent endonuclease n=1 Tax=Candidatus Magasanikbacteria bacterium CG_4_10_14_0_2_um_filter_41_10 TaxID=1974638 RepID=A0A2M7V411_9BACT|nr:MAG: ATP-dependent endonuclease [Candidatus Magasanikbacteria bacterium CG_4_10_14_0_2_um_filter_41_10]